MSKTTFKMLVVGLVAVWVGCVVGLLGFGFGMAALVAGAVWAGGSLVA